MRYNNKLIQVFKLLFKMYSVEKTLNLKFEYSERYDFVAFLNDSYKAQREISEATKDQKEAYLNLYSVWQKGFFNIINNDEGSYNMGNFLHSYNIDGEKRILKLKTPTPTNIFHQILNWLSEIITTIETMHPDLKIMKNDTIKKLNNEKFFSICMVENVYFPEFEKEIPTNKGFLLSLENWEQNKDEFFNQRMNLPQYESLELIEKIEFELIEVQNLSFKEIKNSTLRSRYIKYLNSKTQPEQHPEQTFPELLKPTNNLEVANKLKNEFPAIKGKAVATLVYCLIKENQILNIGTIKRKPLSVILNKFWSKEIVLAKVLNDYLDENYNNKGRLTNIEIKSFSQRIGNLLNNSL